MRNMIMALCLVGLGASGVRAAEVHFSFDETSSGVWEVHATVTGEDTLGLAQYSIWVYTDPAAVSYSQNTLGTIGEGFVPIGFQLLTFGDVGGSFNAGDIQFAGASAILGIGQNVVDEPGAVPGATPHVLLGVPALLGTLTTPDSLGEADFAATTANVLNLANDGVLAATLTFDVHAIPEPGVMSLVGALGLLMLPRRKLPA